MASFRYIDADSYDPDIKEIFAGIIIDVSWYEDIHDVLDTPDSPVYKVMCSDGRLRNFPHWELFEPTEGFYKAVQEKGSIFQEVAWEEE